MPWVRSWADTMRAAIGEGPDVREYRVRLNLRRVGQLMAMILRALWPSALLVSGGIAAAVYLGDGFRDPDLGRLVSMIVGAASGAMAALTGFMRLDGRWGALRWTWREEARAEAQAAELEAHAGVLGDDREALP